eukprot:c17744_g1_i1.p1 GENE.c17744_g1_i1~~c17744_g1_i1.p1  ORF type:complete len:173 (+),score=50.79 c17744_g1_i1:3-521(+)
MGMGMGMAQQVEATGMNAHMHNTAMQQQSNQVYMSSQQPQRLAARQQPMYPYMTTQTLQQSHQQAQMRSPHYSALTSGVPYQRSQMSMPYSMLFSGKQGSPREQMNTLRAANPAGAAVLAPHAFDQSKMSAQLKNLQSSIAPSPAPTTPSQPIMISPTLQSGISPSAGSGII